MSHRCLVPVAILAGVSVILWLPPVPVAGQAPKTKSTIVGEKWTAPRTLWGAPDLQGVWSYSTTTPLQRPAALGEKAFLSDEEIDAYNAEKAGEYDRAPRPGDTGNYNQFWLDRGEAVATKRTSLIIDPPDGRLPFSPEAQKALETTAAYRRAHPADSWLDRTPTDRCIMYHGVPPLPSGYNNTYQIFQTPDLVAILDENIHHVRVIPLDGRPHVGPSIRRWNGDSRGRWEGDTLVVETTNFNDKTRLRYQGSSNTHAVERFRRDGPDLIDYQYTITDPTVFTRPFTVALPMSRRDDRIYEYACHEGNHSMIGILGGARVLEKAAQQEAAKKSSK
jgi:hypothetical protein